MKQVILGAGGAVSTPLAKVLTKYTTDIHLFGRNPKNVNDTDSLIKGDILNYTDVDNAVSGASVVYLMVGLPYKKTLWAEQWPKVMRNTVDACKKHNAKLVFFDNVYMYGLVNGVMNEETPFNPCSKKGEVRAKIATMLLDEVKQGNLQALIARSADFYGVNVATSMLQSTFISNIEKGKSPMIVGNPNCKHNYTFVNDAAIATALLGNTAEAYNQTWHLPTSNKLLSGYDLAAMFSKELNRPIKVSGLNNFMIWMVGLFNPIVGEVREMMYQYNNDYNFDSTKFNTAFNYIPQTPEAVVKLIVQNFGK